MVAGAHDIKIPWPGHEDSVQKRGVAEMWQVLFINIIKYQYYNIFLHFVSLCYIWDLAFLFWLNVEKKIYQSIFYQFLCCWRVWSGDTCSTNFCHIHICFCICSTKGLIRQSSQTTSPSSNWTNPLSSMSEQLSILLISQDMLSQILNYRFALILQYFESPSQTDIRFVQKFRWSVFWAKKSYTEKCANCGYFAHKETA